MRVVSLPQAIMNLQIQSEHILFTDSWYSSDMGGGGGGGATDVCRLILKPQLNGQQGQEPANPRLTSTVSWGCRDKHREVLS